jgi:hypothetical protein
MVRISKDCYIFVVNSINNNFMHNIEYGIGLNDKGRPCIELPEDYEQRPEDRFFAIEVARYILQDLLNRRVADIDEETANKMDEAERLLGQLGDEIASILYDGMRIQGQMRMMMDAPYHIEVIGIERRDALPDKDIVYGNRIYDRVEGLKVYVNWLAYMN